MRRNGNAVEGLVVRHCGRRSVQFAVAISPNSIYVPYAKHAVDATRNGKRCAIFRVRGKRYRGNCADMAFADGDALSRGGVPQSYRVILRARQNERCPVRRHRGINREHNGAVTVQRSDT